MCLPLPSSKARQHMQNKQFVRIVVWVVVISMVLGLGVTVFALLS